MVLLNEVDIATEAAMSTEQVHRVVSLDIISHKLSINIVSLPCLQDSMFNKMLSDLLRVHIFNVIQILLPQLLRTSKTGLLLLLLFLALDGHVRIACSHFVELGHTRA